MINVDDAIRVRRGAVWHEPVWRKATYSSGSGANCVEVAVLPGGGVVQAGRALPAGIAIRDSKNPSQPFLAVSAEAFARFTGRIKDDSVW